MKALANLARRTYKGRFPYLHLEGMRLCAYVPDQVDCSQEGGGEGYWYDLCLDERVQTPGEGVLVVLVVAERFEQPNRGIILVPFQRHVEGAWAYELAEP